MPHGPTHRDCTDERMPAPAAALGGMCPAPILACTRAKVTSQILRLLCSSQRRMWSARCRRAVKGEAHMLMKAYPWAAVDGAGAEGVGHGSQTAE